MDGARDGQFRDQEWRAFSCNMFIAACMKFARCKIKRVETRILKGRWFKDRHGAIKEEINMRGNGTLISFPRWGIYLIWYSLNIVKGNWNYGQFVWWNCFVKKIRICIESNVTISFFLSKLLKNLYSYSRNTDGKYVFILHSDRVIKSI